MLGLLTLFIFTLSAAPMFAREMPARFAKPVMAVAVVVAVVGLLLAGILNDVIAAGAAKVVLRV